MTPVVAVIGANGFIGNRLLEILHLGGSFSVRPVVRRAAALALARRFDIEGSVADACDAAALENALSGCQFVVHAVAGDPETIVSSAEATYRAACRVGAKRMIYLSSASVHGQSPAPGTTDETPLSDRQSMAYNNAKVRAETLLRRLRQGGSAELILLRPGIVYGPRSSWIGGFADDLLAGRAVLVNGGEGICNGIYVDNLVHGVIRALEGGGQDGGAYGVGDVETYRWVDLLSPVVASLGIEPLRIDMGAASVRRVPDRRLAIRGQLRVSVKALLTARIRTALRAGHAAFRAYPAPPPPRLARAQPLVTEETALLHGCIWKLPHDRAVRDLGYAPPVSFHTACAYSIAWLEFAGYPTVRALQSVDKSD